MGSVKLNAGGQCLRFLFIAWNVFVFIIGLISMAVGIYQLVASNDYNFFTGTSYASTGAVSIVAGVIAVLVAVLGAAGGFMLWRWALVLYAIIVSVFVALEIVSAILAFVYRDEVQDKVTDTAVDAIRDDYLNKTDARDAINTIQKDFDCCGWNNYTDWLGSTYYKDMSMFPDSCECRNGTDDCEEVFNGQLVYTEGCEDSVVDLLKAYQLAVGAAGIVFAVLQFSAVLAALLLCCCVHKATGEYTTV